MTSKRRENINLVSFICFSFLVISFSKQLFVFLSRELLCSAPSLCLPCAKQGLMLWTCFL